MNHRGTEAQRKKLTASNESVFSPLRHCEERLSGETKTNKVITVSISNKRRGNLLSLINLKELFSIFGENSLQQSQTKEIASRIQQHQLNSVFNHQIRRLAMTMKCSEATSGIQEARFL